MITGFNTLCKSVLTLIAYEFYSYININGKDHPSLVLPTLPEYQFTSNWLIIVSLFIA